MRRIFLLGLFSCGMILGFYSCQQDEVCGTCTTTMTNDATGVVEKTSTNSYCGTDLENQKKATPVTLDGKTSKVVCK